MTRTALHPTVSVIIPVYNARDVIRDTIQSVLAQTWSDYEIIVVDDGSQDASGDVVRAFGEQIRYIRQENTGVAGARNRGIEESAGEYIALLDHDDLWHPTKLEKQVAVLTQRPEVGLVITRIMHIRSDGTPTGDIAGAYNPDDLFYHVFVKSYVPTPSSAMIRRSAFDAGGTFDPGFDSAGLDDHELWARIATVCEIAAVEEPLTYHRSRPAKSPEIALGHRRVLIAKLLERFGSDPVKRGYLLREQAAYLSDLGKHLLKNGRADEGRSSLREGLRLSLHEGRNLKAASRCMSRLLRSYF
ncbi:MAG TPA: glycosyltransferase family A protein [Nitrospiraceae bacterium]|nr:glycosyltransferase family A protein [Nitrospiraceae bacterium]